jgi:hypothetical protein
VAQLVEQTIRNRQVTSSNLVGGSAAVVFPYEGKPFCFLEDILILKSALAGAFVYKLTARSIVQHKCNLQLDTVFDNVAVLIDLHILVLDPGGPDIPDRFHCSRNTLLKGSVKALGGGSLDLGNTCYSHGKLLSCLVKVGNV